MVDIGLNNRLVVSNLWYKKHESEKMTFYLVPHQNETLLTNKLRATSSGSSRVSSLCMSTDSQTFHLVTGNQCQHLQPPDYKENHLPSNRDPSPSLVSEFQEKRRQPLIHFLLSSLFPTSRLTTYLSQVCTITSGQRRGFIGYTKHVHITEEANRTQWIKTHFTLGSS